MRTISFDDPGDRLDFREGSGGSVEIYDIVVSSERGVGKGRRLVEALFDLTPAGTLVFALTRESNAIAHQFYAALGFAELGRLKGFHQDTAEDAVVFGRVKS